MSAAPPAAPAPLPVPLAPAQRLALSRERLRRALQASAPVRSDADHAAGENLAAAWREGLKSIPGAGVVVDAVRAWWLQHPLRIAVLVATDAAKAVLQPVAQRSPVTLVLLAALGGAAIAWVRPWRWVNRPALFAGLLPQIFNKALQQVPLQSWLAVLTTLAQERRPDGVAPAAAAAEPKPEPKPEPAAAP